MHGKKANPLDTIQNQDKEKRSQEEAEILKKAEELSNGNTGDPALLGKIIVWQVKESISHSTLLRELIDSLRLYQLKEVCMLQHKPKKWSFKLFGATYAAPANVAIVAASVFVYLYMKKEGWI